MPSALLPDPRVFQTTVEDKNLSRIFEQISAYLVAPTQEEKTVCAEVLFKQWDKSVEESVLFNVEEACRQAPSVEVARALFRLVTEWEAKVSDQQALVLRFFAVPLIIVAGAERALSIRSVLGNREGVEQLLRDKGVLGQVQQWGISNALCQADVLSGSNWSEWMYKQAAMFSEGMDSLLKVSPADIAIQVVNQEQVYLRFVVGAALVSPKTEWLKGAPIEVWGLPATELFSQQLAMPSATVLAIPRLPQSLASAVQEGRRLQREIGLQLFTSNALKECRTKFGEPSVVLSSHVMEDGSGEVRISISSEFSVKDAQGFRCVLAPEERIIDVQRMIEGLLAECQVTHVRVLREVYANREPETGLTWLFKPEAIPDSELFE